MLLRTATPKLRFALPTGHPENAQRAWALAMGAPLVASEGYALDALTQPDAPGAASLKARVAARMKTFWSVQDRRTLIATLNWLGREGHRIGHMARLTDYSVSPLQNIAERRKELGKTADYDEDARAELYRIDALLSDHLGMLKAKFLAFDTARAVMLVYGGRLHDWLSEDECWPYLFDMARDVQRTYESWSDYAEDFLRGRSFWKGAEFSERNVVDRLTQKLLSTRHSPWRLMWEQPLPPQVASARLRDVSEPISQGPVWWLERAGDAL
ncbi:DUF1266 domain-containing protein [Acetobacter sp. DsW_063]|uniref:DUF1266 domain-containing protein n=1 Tax=Acetobacter sp. DsW_063 TaxID=1514894 RepID=UPI000A391A3D|nr:DUF1266 domain-containing protein [Acetobacter sp. DsW_063]OUJ14513.1 hypothetical protein HK28_13185 [Acetobacter sp. DsW_063]